MAANVLTKIYAHIKNFASINLSRGEGTPAPAPSPPQITGKIQSEASLRPLALEALFWEVGICQDKMETVKRKLSLAPLL